MNFKSIGNKIKGNPKMIEGTVYSMLIICGILGAAPFAIAMPFVNFTWTIICTFLSGLIIASAFSSIVVYATDLMPDKVGLIAGIFFGLMLVWEDWGPPSSVGWPTRQASSSSFR